MKFFNKEFIEALMLKSSRQLAAPIAELPTEPTSMLSNFAEKDEIPLLAKFDKIGRAHV